jgi:hypothetical protein
MSRSSSVEGNVSKGQPLQANNLNYGLRELYTSFFGEQPPVLLTGLTTSAQTLLLYQKGSFLRLTPAAEISQDTKATAKSQNLSYNQSIIS